MEKKDKNFLEKDLDKMTIFDKGGFEGRIILFNDELVIKQFFPYLKNIIDFENKKYKLARLKEKKIPENIMIRPKEFINVDGEFAGYFMKKIKDSITINNVRSHRKLLRFYKILFENLEIMHKNNIVVGDVKHSNILVKNNKTPIFIDVDSMGVDELKMDHEKKIPNRFANHARRNPRQDIDKLLLLGCFLDSINLDRSSITKNLLNHPNLSRDFKKVVYNILISPNELKLEDKLVEVFSDEERNFKKGRM